MICEKCGNSRAEKSFCSLCGAPLKLTQDTEDRFEALRERLVRETWPSYLVPLGAAFLFAAFSLMSDSFIWGSWEPPGVLDWAMFLGSVAGLGGLGYFIGYSRDERILNDTRGTQPRLANHRVPLGFLFALVVLVSGFLLPNWWFPTDANRLPVSDPKFDTCSEAKSFGYGPYYELRDGEYRWYVDRDSDGVVCE